jgi:hypothetical protein
MNCSVEDSLYSPTETQNMKSKMYVPGIGKLLKNFFLEDFKAMILYDEFVRPLKIRIFFRAILENNLQNLNFRKASI